MSYLLEEGGSIAREAEYVGSFEVLGDNQVESVELVRRRLLQIPQQNIAQRKRVLLEISLSGIKVCFDSFGENVYMTHALKRISYATCHPELCQFSFLARNPKAPASVQFCHMFLTDSPHEASELNSVVSEVFNTAYLYQTRRPGVEHVGGAASSSRLHPDCHERDDAARLDSMSPSNSSVGDDLDSSFDGVLPLPVPNGGGLGSISSITESVNSWSFGVPASLQQQQRSTAETRHESQAPENCTADTRLIPATVALPSSSVVSAMPVDESCQIRPFPVSSMTPTLIPPKMPSICRSLFELVGGQRPRSRSRTRPLSGRYQNDDAKSQQQQQQLQPLLVEDAETSRRQRLDWDGSNTGGPPTPVRFDELRLKEGRTMMPNVDKEMCSASWYKPAMSRENTMDVLSRQDIGAFIVRDSTTHVGCYALSVKVPKYDNPSGISHYLITRTPENMFRIKGLRKEWSCVTALVTHHTVMRELLPCLLRLPTNTDSMTESKLSDKENNVE